MIRLESSNYRVRLVIVWYICFIFLIHIASIYAVGEVKYENEMKTSKAQQEIFEMNIGRYSNQSETISFEEVIPERTLEEVLADPNSKIIDLIPFLSGTYEENLEILAHLIRGESRGGSDESQQYQALIIIVRSFDSSVSQGNGDLKSAVFWKGQYTCTQDGSYYQEPDNQCYQNAAAVLNQELLDPEAPKNLFFIGIAEIKGKGIYKILEEGDKKVYIQVKW